MAKFQIYKDKSGQWRWRLRATGNNETIADSAESYVQRADCQHGIDLVKQQAPTASVEESS